MNIYVFVCISNSIIYKYIHHFTHIHSTLYIHNKHIYYHTCLLSIYNNLHIYINISNAQQHYNKCMHSKCNCLLQQQYCHTQDSMIPVMLFNSFTT